MAARGRLARVRRLRVQRPVLARGPAEVWALRGRAEAMRDGGLGRHARTAACGGGWRRPAAPRARAEAERAS